MTNAQAPKEKSELDKFREEALIAHNEKRALHGAPPIKLSAELNNIAQKYAEILYQKGEFTHSDSSFRNGAGENLAAGSYEMTGAAVTDFWYREINKYDWNDPGFKSDTGHFTQVVWKDCTHMGIGKSERGKNGMYAYVANYSPAGNMIGAFEQNVLPLQ
ncbi:Golgi-associated plant pathogenesis-related protein 1 [Elysia marginata]|uniref:Golgi-associated plant pathogenesis-related protein 1 n=1 Tax=Elysia marginata TaxID=1093978 RepID=A0AAV4GEI5_9GAST|nr:Golgi-associated plant pathogenesis-related protein 1 [Elysia marginata]